MIVPSIRISHTLSSHSSGKWSKISNGSVSAAMTMNSAMPRLRHLVAARDQVLHQAFHIESATC